MLQRSKNVVVNACKGYYQDFPVIVKWNIFDPRMPDPNAIPSDRCKSQDPYTINLPPILTFPPTKPPTNPQTKPPNGSAKIKSDTISHPHGSYNVPPVSAPPTLPTTTMSHPHGSHDIFSVYSTDTRAAVSDMITHESAQ